VGAGRPSALVHSIVLVVPPILPRTGLQLRLSLGGQLRTLPKPWLNNQTLNVGTRWHVRYGTNPANSMANAGVILAETSAATLKGCDICNSIKHRSIPVVCEPDSAGVPTASEALAGAG
jgi:hypothetical protein